jgi:lipopolysaccharide assembly protein A
MNYYAVGRVAGHIGDVPGGRLTLTAELDPGGPQAAEGSQAAAPAVARPPVQQHVVRRTRVGGLWVGLGLAAVVLLFLLVFILENGQQADVAYFGAHGHLPLGIALLLAGVAGALLVIIPGTGRIIQLRQAARRHHGTDAAAPAPADMQIPAASPPGALPSSSGPDPA